MKTFVCLRICSAVILLAAGSFSVATEPLQSPPAHCHSVRFAEHNSSNSITYGSTRLQVETTLGLPWGTLGYDVWFYRNITATTDCGGGCDRLMVTFARDHVVALQLVNRRAEEIYAARFQATVPQKPTVAAKK